MRSLFFRTYLGVITFAVAAFLLIVFVIFKPLLLQQEWQDFKEEIVVDYQLLMLKVEQSTPADWPHIIETHQTVFDMQLSLLDLETLEDKHKAILSQPGPQQVLSSYEDDVWYSLYNLPNSNKVLKISEYDVPFSGLDGSDKFWLLMPLGLISLVQLFAVLLLVRQISTPIQQLANKAESFGQGNLSVRASTDSPEPINRLSQSFNTMADRIDQTIHEQKVMIGAIPHELRTPLSRLRFVVDMTRNKHSVNELRESLEMIDAYVEELDTAVDEVLELARLQNNKKIIYEQFNLAALLKHAVADYTQQTDKTIELHCGETVTVSGNQALIHRSIHNLLQNALQYANANIVINVPEDEENTVIQIDDDGPGIPDDKREEVLALFSRLDKSRNRATGGLGLGLALVKIIMLRHAGTVSVYDSPLGGARVELLWPRIIKEPLSPED